jgi:hypothetical protein
MKKDAEIVQMNLKSALNLIEKACLWDECPQAVIDLIESTSYGEIAIPMMNRITKAQNTTATYGELTSQ